MKLENLSCINQNIDLAEYIKFREEVKKNMENPDWLGDFTGEDLINLLQDNSKIWIYYLDNEPICSMMLIPATEKSLKKFNLNLDYQKVADYGPMFVNPKHLGNALQLQMLQELDRYCEEVGYQYALTTIHPDNIYSIKNILKDDFTLKETKTFKRGIRNIYLKDLTH